MPENSPSSRRQSGISAISIENFKGVSSLISIPLRPITLLFGANSAGKSTIIQALHFAREILDRNNTNADVPVAGGNAIDLGGFRNMVHRHELSRTIRIGFEITPDDDGLPTLDEITGVQLEYDIGYWQTLERNRIFETLVPDLYSMTETPEKIAELARRMKVVRENLKLVEGRQPDISLFIKRAGLQLAVSWDSQKMRPWLSEVLYSLDGMPMFTIAQENEGSVPAITKINYDHPAIRSVFTPILAEEVGQNAPTAASEFEGFLRERTDSQGRVLLRGQRIALPDLTKPLPFGVSMDTADGNYGYEFFIAAIINQVILGSTWLLKKELAQLRYVGPIRERPRRDQRAPAVLDESRWADGSAAWDLILSHYDPASRKGDSYVQDISKWMQATDKLNLEYSLDVSAKRILPEESMLMANLRLLKDQFDEKDQEFYKRLVWPEIESSPVEVQLELHDLKNDVAVGPADLGVGVIQVVPIIAASLDSEKRLIALEQPELHLHPRVACNLGDLFIAQIAKGKLFLIESHSEHLMLRIKRRIREKQIDSGDVSVLFVEAPKAGGKTCILPLRLDSEGEFLDEWPGGFFEEGFAEIFGKAK